MLSPARNPGAFSRSCRYFNWRTDTFSDLLLFLGFNLVLFAAGATVQATLFAHAGADTDPNGWWLHFYEVCKTVFGQVSGWHACGVLVPVLCLPDVQDE